MKSFLVASKFVYLSIRTPSPQICLYLETVGGSGWVKRNISKLFDVSLLTKIVIYLQEGIAFFAYDVGELNNYADYVNIMTYDYHFYSKETPFTGNFNAKRKI